MRKLFLKFLMLLFVLLLGTNVMWGQGIGGIMDGIDPENPATWFYVNLTAQPSTPACGTNPGQVWLRSVAPTGDEDNPYADSNPYILPDKPANPYDEENDNWNYRQWSEEYGFSDGMNDAEAGLTEKNYRSHYNDEGWTNAVKEGYDAGWDWYKSGHFLNPVNPVGFAATVSLKGYTVVYAPGFEDMNVFGNVFSAYASFYGKAQENDGWYFTGWSYTDGDSDLGVGDENGVLFRVLPSATAGEANIRNEHVYATFKPVLVANYRVGGMINVGTSATNYGETTVVFDAAGERVSATDFTASVADANFTATITNCADNKVTVTVRFTNPGSLSEEVYRGNVKLASKSGCSELTAAVYARVGGASDKEASLYDGKSLMQSGDVTTLLNNVGTCANPIISLNKDYTKALTTNVNVTLDLNGYNMTNTLTVSGGELAIAYNKYGGRGTGVAVTGGKLVLNGAEFASLSISAGATVEQNGALITGAVTNNGTLITTEGHVEGGLTSAGTLTISGGTFEGATAITITGGTATFNKGAISGSAYGIQLTGGTTTITSKLVSVYGGTRAVKQTSGSVTLNNGKYDGVTPLDGSITLNGGYFKVDGEHLGISLPVGKKVLNVLSGTEFAEGYRYFVGDDASSVGVCRIGTTTYETLEKALAYANNNTDKNVTIIMTNDYTLPAGYYTLPARATLIVPMSDEQEIGYEIVNRVTNNSVSHTDYVQPYEFRRLAFAYGVNMDVHGTIELSGTQRASDDGYAAMPHGAYGHLVMEEGSHMTLQNGSLLRAWGFMTGKGETDARRGSKVREQFQMGDWKGGSISFSMLADDRHVFPITQYFIQNVESPVKYHPGALLSTTTSVSAAQGGIALTAMANDIVVVGVSGGDPAMFFMDQEADAENTWVRKWYDAEHDVQTYDVNSGAHIGSMVLDLGKLGTQPLVMNSATFVLPITNNMKIHLLSGQMDFTQTTALLPGAEVEVDKESTVTIYASGADKSALASYEAAYNTYLSDYANWEANPEGDAPEAPVKPILSTGELFVYDADEWGNYAKGKGDTGTKYTKVVKYSPSWDGALVSGKPADGKPNVRHEDACPDDATINVHGTFNTGDGAVYTTAGGANIYSRNEDAGTFIVNRPTPTYTAKIYQVKNANANTYEPTEAVSAKLKNGVGAAEPYTATAGTGTNLAFLYRDNAWQAPLKENIVTFYFDCYTAEVDMAVYADEAGKKLQRIMAQQQYPTMEQLWPTYDLGKAVQHIYIKPQEWLEIAGKAIIEFDYDLEALMAAYTENGEEGLAAYWEICANNPYLEGVEGNADHTYSDADGAGRLFILMQVNCQWWEVENKDNLYHCIHPENDTYYYWDEDDEMWAEQKFTISWRNWNGTIIQTADGDGTLQDSYVVKYGTMAEFLGTNPTREANIDYTYDFTGWSPALGPVKSDVTYTATFTEKPRMYTIIFQQEGGVEIERHFLTHNEVPVCENVPTKVGHTLQWDPAIAAVTGDATYTATWLEEPPTEYEITFFDYDGTSVLQQGEVKVGVVPEYTESTPSGKPATSEFTYVFDHWSPALEEVSATSAKSYTAVYREEDQTYTVRFYQEDGTTQIGADQSLAYGAMPVAPTSGVDKQNPAPGYSYTYIWQNKADASKTIEAVKANANYKAVFTGTPNKYTVSVKSNPSGACAISGAGLYDYSSSATLILSVNDGYTFTGWSDGLEGTNTTRTITVTEDKELVANFNVVDPDYTITWKNEAGTANLVTPVGQKSGTATIYTGATPTKDATTDKTFTFYGWSTAANGAGTVYKNGMTPKATANATYYAYFNEEARQYTISWKNEAGTSDIEVDYNQNYGATTAFNSATPTKPATAAAIYTFDGWATSANGSKAYNIGATPTVSGDAAYYAHFASTAKTYTITWLYDDGSLIDRTEVAYNTIPTHTDPVKAGSEFTGWDKDLVAVTGLATYTAQFSNDNIEIGINGEVDLDDAVVEKHDLIITSNGSTSGDLRGASNLTLSGEAIFRLEKPMSAGTWYAVAVPWIVDINTGIYNGAGKRLAVGDIYVIEFVADAYASADYDEGRSDYWKFLDETGNDMVPGKLYMIYLKSGQSVLEFHKTGGKLLNTTTSVAPASGSVAAQSNWNAIANPALYHANLTIPGAVDVLRHNGGDSYIVGSTAGMIVGEPMFVQVATSATITASPTMKSPMPAYRRAPQTETDNRFVLELTNEGRLADRMIVQTAEEKANEYVIGKDLSKMGISATVAQMWIERYNTNLCKNTVEMFGEYVDYPLHISAPASGAYVLSSVRERGSAILYLTRNEQPIWNLSDGNYTLHLDEGTSSEYGLRLYAPKVATDIINITGENADNAVRKVLIEDQIRIIRGEKVYSIDGKLVK